MNTAAIILAAGAASRMKQAKMLLPFKKGTILSHILEQVEWAGIRHSCLVTGCYHDQILLSTALHQTHIAYNKDWVLGMASSITTGLRALLQLEPDLDAVIILVADQPLLTSTILQQLMDQQAATGKGIIAARYQTIFGTPVLFEKKYFDALMLLEGDKGAKSILNQHPEDLDSIDFPEGIADIDTPEAYHELVLKTKG